MKNSPNKRLILLDSHAIIHRAYHGMPDFSNSKGEPTGALYGLSTMLMKIIADLKPDYIVACYDLPEKTFRHLAYDAYKGTRAKTDDNLISQLEDSRKIFTAFDIPMYDCPGFEADDMLGTIVEQNKKEKNLDIVIASGDMDTMQLIEGKKVQVFTLKKGINDTIIYDEEAVLARFSFGPKLLPDYKGLRGDPSDNIIGIKGIGEKTATTLISSFGTIEEIYKVLKKSPEKIKSAGVTDRIINLLTEGEEEALFSKTLATIRRDAPIKFVLPEKTFLESVDTEKIRTLFVKLEFKSLMPRIESAFGKSVENQKIKEEVKVEIENVDKDILHRALIALWLVDSDISNPKLEDLLSHTKKNNFIDAEKQIFLELEKNKLNDVYEQIEKPLIPIVAEMEDFGISIDKDFFEKLSKDYHKTLDSLTAKIYELAGGEFNINSPKQLGEVLFEKLNLKTKGKRGAGGSFSTKVSVLEELEDAHPLIPLVMQYRELQKLLSTYIDIIPSLVAPDGRLHAKFLQNGTTTGRFSSIDPNLQNIPIRTELGRAIRNGFVAGKGKKLIAFDYSQIELRVVAILSGDEKLIDIFKNGKDVHTSVASAVFNVSEENVDSDMRRKAKVINFGIIYGMGVSALKKNLGTTRDEAEKFLADYFNQFSGVRKYLDNVKDFASKNGYTETFFGRRRQFPTIRSHIPYIRAMAERTATNAPIQGTATADIIKLAIIFIDQDLKKSKLIEKAHLIMQIHDELVYEVDESSVGEVEKIIKKAMEEVLERSYKNFDSPVPLAVHYGMGQNLGEVK